MRKIISLFQRNYEGDRLVRNEVVPGAEWVLAGEGVPTRKWDGTACMVKDGKLYKRYTLKKSRKAPDDFKPTVEMDHETGKQEGWIPVGDGPEDAVHRLAAMPEENGTYELVGPKVQGNPEQLTVHYLVSHAATILQNVPRNYQDIKTFLADLENDIEGIVWHHPDGRMAKIKKRDFGFRRKPKGD